MVRVVRVQLKKDKRKVLRPTRNPTRKSNGKKNSSNVFSKCHPRRSNAWSSGFSANSGFIEVEVTGQTGDGGVDGHGILRLGGLLSFHVIFQAKRWKGAVGASQVRDFRGAMVGRADKGLLITTGAFTKDAIKEATRDGAPAIDLVDGDQLVEKLKQLSLGVSVRKIEIEQVSIDHDWFSRL